MSSFTVYAIGRNPDSDIHIDHPSVSRAHAELLVTADGRFYITDCNSSGGTAIRKSGTGPWEKTRQGYVAKTDAVLLGALVTSVQELLLGVRAGKKVAAPGPSGDDLPEGPVRRDIFTGGILKQED